MRNNFNPTEIIFATTSACNLRCEHCFVHLENQKLEIESAKNLLIGCNEYGIEKVGFSGGEPFLYPEFLIEIIKQAINENLFFDRIMTNGVWWNSKKQLFSVLNDVYQAGFDGKIGLSFDSFHNQDISKIITFIQTIYQIWNDPSMIEIQSVVPSNKNDTTVMAKEKQFLSDLQKLSDAFKSKITDDTNASSGLGYITIESDSCFIPITRTQQSFLPDNCLSWKDSKWFKDDYCAGPGQILFVHSNGNIAPCCGFANENKALIIGNINQTLSEIIENSKKNPMVDLCYNKGLGNYRLEQEKKGIVFPGITNDMCMFCAYICDKK